MATEDLAKQPNIGVKRANVVLRLVGKNGSIKGMDGVQKLRVGQSYRFNTNLSRVKRT